MTEVKSADKEEREGRCKAGRGEGEEEGGGLRGGGAFWRWSILEVGLEFSDCFRVSVYL